MTKNKEVADKKSTELAAFDPAMFEADAGQGMENMGQEDLALPFLKVLSGNDPILDENEVARKGDIYNTVTGMVYKGKDGISVIPCAYQRRFIQWAPRGSGNGAPTAIYEPGEVRPETQRSTEDTSITSRPRKRKTLKGRGTVGRCHVRAPLLKQDSTFAPKLLPTASPQVTLLLNIRMTRA